MASNNNYLTQKDDFVITVLSKLKALGVKVPNLKKSIAPKSKQEITTSENGCKIFGSSLYEQEWITDGEPPLPKFLVMATEYLQKFIKQEGLFRKAGNISRQRNLKAKIERRETFQEANPNDVACLLKQWLRDLKEPLIPFYLQKLFIRCICLAVEKDRVSACLLTILLLPPENQHILKHIVSFLSLISMNYDRNKMDIHNLAIIMAPNIFATNDSSEKTNNLLNQHTAVLELLIENSDRIDDVPFSNFKRTILGADLHISVDTTDTKSIKYKKKLIGPVQDIFFGFKKLVCQTGFSFTSKSSSEDIFKIPKNPRPAVKRKLDPHELPLKTTENKKQTLYHENLNSLELNRPNGKEATAKVEKRRDSRTRRKSFGALLLRQKRRKRPEKENPLLAPDLLADELNCGKDYPSEKYNYRITLADINSNSSNPNLISPFSKKEKDAYNIMVNSTGNIKREMFTTPFHSEYKTSVEYSKNSYMCVENDFDTFKTTLPSKTLNSASYSKFKNYESPLKSELSLQKDLSTQFTKQNQYYSNSDNKKTQNEQIQIKASNFVKKLNYSSHSIKSECNTIYDKNKSNYCEKISERSKQESCVRDQSKSLIYSNDSVLNSYILPQPISETAIAPNINKTACTKDDAKNTTQSLDLSLKLLIQNFCKSPPKESFDDNLGINFLSNKSNPEFKVNISQIETPASYSQVRTSTSKILQTPVNRAKRIVRSSSQSGSKIPRVKCLPTPNRQSSFSCRVTSNRRQTKQLNSNSEYIPTKIPIMQLKCDPAKEESLEVQNDSVYGTPNSSPTNWMDDTQYLSFLSSPDDEIIHKRESIAKILKENPGHVQAKISLFDKNPSNCNDSSSSSVTKSDSSEVCKFTQKSINEIIGMTK